VSETPPSPVALPSLAAVVLAAGMGTRMRSKLPKMLHPVGGRPMVAHALRVAESLSPRVVVIVVGHAADQVRAALGPSYAYAMQESQLGTGHAVLQALPYIPADVETVLVLFSDTPLLSADTVRALVERHAASRARVTLLTAIAADPAAYGRIIRDNRNERGQGRVTEIVEAKQATAAQWAITEINSGVACFDAAFLREALPALPPSPSGEIYLTDLVARAFDVPTDDDRWPVAALVTDAEEAMGINDRAQLAEAEAALRRRVLRHLMRSGVTITDPATTYIDDTVIIGTDTTVLPGCVLRGETTIGEDCEIGPYALLNNSRIGSGCRVVASTLDDATMRDGSDCGPYSRLRGGAVIEGGAHIGNFAEVKNSTIGPHTAVGHFSYIGDATVGADVNIGAGAITANYDGTPVKRRTTIGDGAFIGSGTVLRAPVAVGAGARTGGQAFVNRDVPPGVTVAGVPARPLPEQQRAASGERRATDEE